MIPGIVFDETKFYIWYQFILSKYKILDLKLRIKLKINPSNVNEITKFRIRCNLR